jgi:hypothetical protein
MGESFLAKMASLEWWVTVVIGAMLLNVLGNYATRLTDWMFGSSFKWWSTISAKRADGWNRKMLRLASTAADLRAAQREEIRNRLRAIQFTLMAVILSIPGWLAIMDKGLFSYWVATLSNVLSVFHVFMAFSAYRDAETSAKITGEAIAMRSLMEEARKQQ